MTVDDDMKADFAINNNPDMWRGCEPHSPADEHLFDMVIQLQLEVVRLQRIIDKLELDQIKEDMTSEG